MPIVFIPSLLRGLTGGEARVVVPGRTLGRVIANLDAEYPGLAAALLWDELDNEALDPLYQAAIDGTLDHLGLLQPLREDSEVIFVPAQQGG
jgi:sulfur-carrier protein